MEASATHEQVKEGARKAREGIEAIRAEISKAIVGHADVIEGVIVCLLCSGHALIEGVPGLGKTYLIKTLGSVLGLHTSRIQFTPDLMPADIIGTNVLVQGEMDGRTIQFQKGPVFAQIVLADEINRATPKTQAALLEAMQEQNVTVGGTRYPLELPFMVLATMNPIEMEGTYPLPEAQLDRFFFKLQVNSPDADQISSIIDRTTRGTLPDLTQVLSRDEVLEMQKVVVDVALAETVKDYAIRLVLTTHPGGEHGTEMVNRYVRYGSSPRGAQSLVLAGKVLALIDGRYNVDFEDIRRAALPGLRHRIILSFEGEAEGISTDTVISDMVGRVSETK